MAEFDRTVYTELVAGRAMPELTLGVLDVEIIDWNDVTTLHSVPTAAVQALHMPILSSHAPQEVRRPFEQGIGMALIACQILNKYEDLLSIVVPSEPPATIVIPMARLAKRITRRI